MTLQELAKLPKNQGHGGKRDGAGRLRLDPEYKKIPIKVGIQQWKVDKYGGVLEMQKMILKFIGKLK